MSMLNKDFVDVRLEFTMKRIGKNIKRLRKERGWSQEKLALEIGSSQSVIHDIECNPGYNPTIFTIIKISTAFNLTLSDISSVHLKV
jgi:transcriptional regulator with XRE-family HTH domain